MPDIIIESQTKIKDGYILVWRNADETNRHNTFTWDPEKWIEGYRNGVDLMELQKISKPQDDSH